MKKVRDAFAALLVLMQAAACDVASPGGPVDAGLEDARADAGTDAGSDSIRVSGRVAIVPYGVPVEPGGKIFAGVFDSVDGTGLIPAGDAVEMVEVDPSILKFTLMASAGCSRHVIAWVDSAGSGKKRPQPGDNVGAYRKNPVCEKDIKALLRIDHIVPGGTPPVTVGRNKKEAVEKAIGLLTAEPGIDFSAYMESGILKVFSARGDIEIRRNPDGSYGVEVARGENPFMNDGYDLLSTYESELAAGANPAGTVYPGYKSGDPRLSFIEVWNTSYPNYAERLWQVFEDRRCGDIVTFPVPYGAGAGGVVGEHGSLNITQSRAVLIVSGAGVKKGVAPEGLARSVDVAPTVLKALGASTTAGVGLSGFLESGKLLKWQDGAVLEEALDGSKAEYAMIFVLDGASFTEISRALEDGDPELTNIKSLVESGAFFRYGQITNYPSITLPAHISIGTGAYSGHHGFANNIFYDREEGKVYNIASAGFEPSRFLRPWVETVFEAVQRSWGYWDDAAGTGTFTASVNEPSTRGAAFATLEGRFYNYFDEKFDPLPVTAGFEKYSDVDNAGVNQIIYLLERKTGLPLPKITMINLALNDFVGHSTGPHSDLIRSSSLADTDFRTGRILDAYRKAGIFEKTIFVITGDHGQEMQDRNRSLPYRVEGEKFILPLFEDAGIKYIGAPPFVYFRTIGLSVDPGVLPQAGPVSLSVTAFDYDTRKALASTAIEAFTGGKAAGSCTTGEGGACSIDIADAAGGVKIVAERADYNKAEWP